MQTYSFKLSQIYCDDRDYIYEYFFFIKLDYFFVCLKRLNASAHIPYIWVNRIEHNTYLIKRNVNDDSVYVCTYIIPIKEYL